MCQTEATLREQLIIVITALSPELKLLPWEEISTSKLKMLLEAARVTAAQHAKKELKT